MRPRLRQRKRSSFEFLMPFLILICIGVIAVLLFNLWSAIFSTDPGDAAYMHIDGGSVQIKTWGTEQFFDLRTDALVMQGDEIRSSANSKVIIEFFDGTIMRLSGGSAVVFEHLDDNDGDPEIEFTLLEGDVWVNRVYKNTEQTSLLISLGASRVNLDTASVVSVSSEIEQEVRVLNVFNGGEGALVEILDEERSKVIESERVDVGQEVVLNPKVLKSYWDFRSPTVLSALSDDFKEGAWYEWNIEEDQDPTEFDKYAGPENAGLRKVEPEMIDSADDDSGSDDTELPEDADVETDAESDADAEEDEESVKEEVPEVSGDLAKPSISSVSGVSNTDENGFYWVKSGVGVLQGSVSGATSVVVNGYTLKKFSPGASTWTYYANADFGLMSPGQNNYEVYALDANGNKSEVLNVKVYYDAQAATTDQEEEGQLEDGGEADGSGENAEEDADAAAGDGTSI